MTSGFHDVPELHDEVRRHVAAWNRVWADPVALIAPVPWLHSELGEVAPPVAASEPERQWESLLAIDALWRVPHPLASLSSTGRVYFVSITAAPRRPEFSATQFLWESGFSVIDVSRPVLAVHNGVAELAIGIARRTPTRVGDQ